MIRFIAKRKIRNIGDVTETLETLDIEVPALESWLTRGGFGGGPDNDDFDYTLLIGAEVRKSNVTP